MPRGDPSCYADAVLGWRRSRKSGSEVDVDELAKRVDTVEAFAADAVAALAAQQRAMQGLDALVPQ